MRVESLEVLEKADVAPAQARAIVRAIEIEIAGARETLPTNRDRAENRLQFELFRKEMSEATATLCRELKAQIRASASGIIRQMYLGMLAQTTVLLEFAYFATHLR
ncbi:MAG TPA: hypothetical protein VMU03_15875 [Gammaproteobacteria bacterium]|nr:hypothetical protein [Gammaproteobacteria bacterium]